MGFSDPSSQHSLVKIARRWFASTPGAGTTHLRDNICKTRQQTTNELLAWIVTEIRDEGSPIFGFPQAFVEKAAKNVMAPSSGADREFFYPLHSKDFNPVLHQFVLPKIALLLKTHGPRCSGWVTRWPQLG